MSQEYFLEIYWPSVYARGWPSACASTSNIDNTGNIRGYLQEMGQNLPSRARRRIQENDVIISSIEGSIDKIALVSNEFHNSLCSTGFYVLNSNKINSETLLVLFKNKIIQQLLKQKCSGIILMWE